MNKIVQTPTLFIDESGNTGSNLLDSNQPIFTLASCIFSHSEATYLLGLIGSKSQHEIHFKNIKRRRSGQDGIVRMMSDKLINLDNFKISIFHKEFMILTKIVDILIEHMFSLNGKDLYLNGQNIAISNMLYNCLKTFCKSELIQEMYKNFINMISNQKQKDIDAFYRTVMILKESSTNNDFRNDLNIILATKNYVYYAIERIDKHSLDPSIPALFSHCALWGKDYPKGFHIMHDDSHSIQKQKLIFAQFMDWTQEDVEIGYDRRKFNLPLKGKSLKFVSSEKHAQIQVSDVIASAFSYWASGVNRGETEDYLFLELKRLELDKFIGHNKIWPTPDVTPNDLNTVHNGGKNTPDHAAIFLNKAVPNPKIIDT